MGRRAWIYGGMLAITVVAFGVNTVAVHGLEGELQVVADEKIQSFRDDEPAEALARLKIGATVVVSKSYVLFGDPLGKVSVFLQHDDGSEDLHFEGYEFFFAREESGEWTQTESGMCTSEECTQEGLRILRKLNAQ